MRNVLGVVELSERESGSLPVFLYSAFFILSITGTAISPRILMGLWLQIVSVETIELVPGSGDRLKRKEVNQMNWGTRETIDVYKAMILDMNEDQLRFALLMIINGTDLPYAIDQALAIYKELKL